MSDGFHRDQPSPNPAPRGVDPQRIPEFVKHLTFALSAHVRRLRQEGLPVPTEFEELAGFLAHCAWNRPGPPDIAEEHNEEQHAPMLDRLLVTKGEAAEWLSVSVRTIERLVATGRLPQVHVERAVRFRVRDLQAYVDGLSELD
jgi:excisionase family DNA binding protein